MSDENAEFIKIYRAPNRKFYAIWGGHPVCTANGGLRYFDTESEARARLVDHQPTHAGPGDIAA